MTTVRTNIKASLPQEVINALQPKKSSVRYKQEYSKFMEWLQQHQYAVTEEAILLYSVEMSKSFSPSSVRSKISMIKQELLINGTILESSQQLNLHIKRINTDYSPKKAAVFSKQQLEIFLLQAPDVEFLMWKFIFLVGFFGCARSDDLWKILWKDIEACDQGIRFRIFGEKNQSNRISIAPSNVSDGWNLSLYYEKIKNLRTVCGISVERAFVRYENGKLFNQVNGKTIIGLVPRKIAVFLGIKDVDDNTGHSIRRTSATIGAENGISVYQLRELGGWKSENVATSYVQSSNRFRTELENFLVKENNNENSNKTQGVNVSNLNNCTLNFHL